MLDTMIDNHFVSLLEYKIPDIKFKRVDSFISDSLKNDKTDEKSEENTKISEMFKGILKESEKISVQTLKNNKIPALFVLSEESRRMQ